MNAARFQQKIPPEIAHQRIVVSLYFDYTFLSSCSQFNYQNIDHEIKKIFLLVTSVTLSIALIGYCLCGYLSQTANIRIIII